MTQSMSAVAGGRRRRTDLIPTIPVHRADLERSPRSPHYANSSSSSRGSVSRSTGMSVSMSRLDQLSRPPRRRTNLQPLHENASPETPAAATPTNHNSSTRTLSRTRRQSADGRRHRMSKSMSHLPAAKAEPKASATCDGPTTADAAPPRTTRAERLRQMKARQASSGVREPPRPAQSTTNAGGWPQRVFNRLTGLGRHTLAICSASTFCRVLTSFSDAPPSFSLFAKQNL